MKRTNEEFKAEVFSRSDKIIQRRKKIKRVAMCCVPVLLCSFIGIYAISMGLGRGVKAENSANDGAIGNPNFDYNYSVEEEENEYGTPAAPGAVPEASDKGENRGEGILSGATTSVKAVAVTVQSAKSGVSSHINDENTAQRLHKLINRVVENAAVCQKNADMEYSVSIHFSDNTVTNCSIAGNALICKDGIYLIDAASYDSILQIIGGIIS